ncbi:hypothetical protein E2C01_056794 [Portunus trituberculatus]|uniref:Uncharacterized protein n=1 Tax=Portunus trituberculatus TaxID=210409 RepID=A0A5B7GZ68_PORTR|nr:hypothetical protein [Portunus trituberculatus]
MVEPFNSDTNLNEENLRPLEGGNIIEAPWIAPHCLPRYVTSKWLSLKGSHAAAGVLGPAISLATALLPRLPLPSLTILKN